MKKQGCFLGMLFVFLLLSGCIGSVWTGAKLLYDRHDIYVALSDYQLSIDTRRALYSDNTLKHAGCSFDLAVFNGDILLAGHVPDESTRQLVLTRLKWISGYRHLYVYVTAHGDTETVWEDHWITTKIRGKIFADSEIDPDQFKVITADGHVYLMGDVIANQGKWVIDIARNTQGVVKVVDLMNYYTLAKKNSL